MADKNGTQTQPRPNISTENHSPGNAPPTETQPAPNISTEHQKTGDARKPDDSLGRDQPEQADDGGRRSSLTDPDAT